ncbi:hypothetical protein ACTA71_000131 [Dictyostelium dimigraforme]
MIPNQRALKFNRWIPESLIEGFGDYCQAYVDDIIIFPNNIDYHHHHHYHHHNKVLGRIISQEGIRVKDSKVEAILNIDYPKTIKEVRSLLSACNIYSYIDASDIGTTDCVLTQFDDSGLENTILYDHSKFTKEQQVYTATNREFLALLHVLENKLSEFNFEIRHIRGEIKAKDYTKSWLDIVQKRGDVVEINKLLYLVDPKTDCKRLILIDENQITKLLEAHSTTYILPITKESYLKRNMVIKITDNTSSTLQGMNLPKTDNKFNSVFVIVDRLIKQK